MSPSLWLPLAACSYAASCTLGFVVKFRLFDSSMAHWLHHALYIVTFALSAVGVATVFFSRNPAGWYLLPALVPLAAIPFISSHSNRHIYLALSAAPFFILSLIIVWSK